VNDISSDGAGVRAAAARVVDAVVSGGRSLDVALPAAEADVATADRSLLALLAYEALRRYWRLSATLDAALDRPLAKRDRIVHALLLVGLVQITGTRVPDHAAVSATVEACRLVGRPRLAGLVNAVLRRCLRDNLAAREPGGEAARYDHPQWLIDAFRRDWPDDWQSILSANNERAPMWLRVNTVRTDAQAYLERLHSAGIGARTMPALPAAIRLDEPLAAASLPGFVDGDVSVQDAAAQLAAPWLLEDDGGRVLDACAAPGGKTAHLAELGGGKIALTAVDVDADRLARVGETLERLGLAANVVAGDAASPETWWDGERFRRILLDAPCSASGVIRRHPDIKHLRRPRDIAALAARQRALLDRLWRLLEPGGRFLYVTCSVLRAENAAVVGAFLDATPDATENELLHNNNIRALMRRMARGYQLLPGTGGMDGFYFACLEKNG
jgi:16S rRNA (cytosine967-C5)-methyltransferase